MVVADFPPLLIAAGTTQEVLNMPQLH